MQERPESSSIVVLDGQLFFVGGHLLEPTEEEAGETSKLAALDGQLYSVEDNSGEGSGNEGADGLSVQNAVTNCFFKLTTETGEIEKVGGSMPCLLESIGSKVAASGSKIYYFGVEELYDDYGNSAGTKKHLLRFTYDAAANEMTTENITSALESANPLYGEVVGQDIGAHFALAGLPDGVAIVGSDTLGEDTHIILDSANTATSYARTSSYHRTFDPLAVYADDYLYAMGNNSTEPDVMYFRATNYDAPEPAPTPVPEERAPLARTTSSTTPSELAKTSDNAQLMIVTAGIGAVAGVVCLMASFALARKRCKPPQDKVAA